uniref:Uncharacterized protein n=1 Tax=Anguilla anguilla TaxID=7936 RepID=A0A0E9WTF0_ANGAN
MQWIVGFSVTTTDIVHAQQWDGFINKIYGSVCNESKLYLLLHINSRMPLHGFTHEPIIRTTGKLVAVM